MCFRNVIGFCMKSRLSGSREVSKWLRIEILLQVAFGRARGDFSRPQARPGTMSTWHLCNLHCGERPQIALGESQDSAVLDRDYIALVEGQDIAVLDREHIALVESQEKYVMADKNTAPVRSQETSAADREHTGTLPRHFGKRKSMIQASTFQFYSRSSWKYCHRITSMQHSRGNLPQNWSYTRNLRALDQERWGIWRFPGTCSIL